MAESKGTKGKAAQTAAAPKAGLIDDIITKGSMARSEDQKPHARDLIAEFASQVLDQGMTVSGDMVAALEGRIAQIDKLLSDQVNEIMHHAEFQKLEASWRGLRYLVMETETGTMLKLRVLNVSKKELQDDAEKATEFDQSALFKKVYEEEYGTFGGHPYGLLVGDYEFGRHPQDIGLLEKLASVAAAAHAPFIAASSAGMFDMASFTELGVPRDLAKIFESSELIKWRSFREAEDSRYVGLCMPHVMLRLPYGPATVPVEEFDFVEDVDGTDHDKYLWGNAAWALGARITAAFAEHRWCAAIRGVEGGGLVSGLPVHTIVTPDGDIGVKPPTEVAITDRREKELSDLGFIPLCYSKDTDFAAFFATQTAHKAEKYDTAQATANADLSAQLQYILAASRFAHYLKVMMRDKIGSFMSREEVESFLNRWIANYVLLSDTAAQSVKAKFPLREARVDVTDNPAKPGCYSAVAFLRPHFQLNELTASIRLVAELPPPAG
ncbi:MAG: type VI secretion system protein ImpC [Myxococcota bacterium]|jgi:type VI secretion system protein ImpC